MGTDKQRTGRCGAFNNKDNTSAISRSLKAPLDAIDRLRDKRLEAALAENAILRGKCDQALVLETLNVEPNDIVRELKAENTRLTAERDAAVKDIVCLIERGDEIDVCRGCAHFNTRECEECSPRCRGCCEHKHQKSARASHTSTTGNFIR